MVVKVYLSGISGNKEVKKRQQRVLMILDSRNIKYEVIDIAEPGNEEHKDFMQNNSTSMGGTIGDPNPRHPLPPQIFSDDIYCGDYEQFDLANEIDEMEKFLKMAPDDSKTATSSAEIKLGNGDIQPAKEENGTEKQDEPKPEETDVEETKAEESKTEESSEDKKEEATEDKADEEGKGDENKDESNETKDEAKDEEEKDQENQAADSEKVENGKEETNDAEADAEEGETKAEEE